MTDVTLFAVFVCVPQKLHFFQPFLLQEIVEADTLQQSQASVRHYYSRTSFYTFEGTE
jgi:hypothetical protein